MAVDESGDRVAAMQMNAELRQAQLEMLSAQCATDRLRLRYSAEQIARHAQRDTLRKAWLSASALYEYYQAVVKHLSGMESNNKSPAGSLDDAKTLEAIRRVGQYYREQRSSFRRTGLPLEPHHRKPVAAFFPATLLDQIRVVILDGQRIPNPPFYNEARALGLENLPELTQMASITFEDVVVFHGGVTARSIFHGLVHAVQLEVLGAELYIERLVRGFLRTRSHATVPLEAHAFQLETEYASNPDRVFSVEEKVWLWSNQGRY